ncbi:AMP-binding protein [Myxococcota bacterium]|nr:AMP-binding protein [Myxococcota bacterium]
MDVRLPLATSARGPILNVADHVSQAAAVMPNADAVIIPGPRGPGGKRTYRRTSFAELEASIQRWARGFAGLGVTPGMRVLLMVTPSVELFGITFALFHLGAIPVLIDPGMGRKRVLGAIEESEAEVFVGVPKAHVVRTLFPKAFRAVKIPVTVGKKLFWGGATMADVDRLGAAAKTLDVPPVHAEDVAAVLFTSGSTGAPKGVLYTQAIFDEQTRIFREYLKIRPGEVDLSAFPLFSLFSLALGVSVVVPDMDATRPAKVDPKLIVESIEDLGVTYAFGSPAFWRRIAAHCTTGQVRLGTLKRVLMAGAPAPTALLRQLVSIIPETSDVFTPYGATESLPISLPSARDLLAGAVAKTESGAGTCVGHPLPGTRVEIIRIDDAPIASVTDVERLPRRKVGEIMVHSRVTTRSYFRRPSDDAKAKVREGAVIWHRMGDVGYLDEEGCLWFCGRKSHRVETEAGPMYTEPVEGIFNTHPAVRRSALVGVGPRGAQRPVIIIELDEKSGRRGDDALTAELVALAAKSPVTAAVDTVLYHPAFPVDPRHNAKIIRETLAEWAGAKLRINPS